VYSELCWFAVFRNFKMLAADPEAIARLQFDRWLSRAILQFSKV